MNAPAQIITALVAVGAVAILPLSAQYEEAGILEAAVKKREDAARFQGGSASKSGTTGAEGKVEGKAEAASDSDRIPAGVSPAVASQTIADLAALDGKMLSTRQIIALLDKIMALPVSHLEEARAVIQETRNPIMGGFLYSALFSRWGELDPDAARTALEANTTPNPIYKFAGAASLAGGWMEKDPDSFLKWLNEDKEGMASKDKELRENMMNGLLSGMANIDNATAEKLIAAAPKDRRAWMIMDMAERDPNIDPRDAAARALAEAGDNEGQRSSINWRIGRLLAERDPQDAIKYAEQQSPKERGQTYEAAMSSWVRDDKAEAMKWLKGQPPEVQKDAVRGLRHQMDDMSYEEVAKLSGEVKGDAAASVWSMALDETADRNPQEALRYLPNVSEAQRPNSYNEIAQAWTKKDPKAASEWIYDLSPGKEKDHAITGMVRELRSKEPDSSTIWASTIGDEGMRGNLVSENARTWLKRDRAAAEEWIHATESISQEQKDKLLESR